MSNKANQEGSLTGRTAVVTGASRGIGLAIAKRLVDQGARVCITARGAEALDEAASAFPAGTVLGIAGKADDPAHRAEVFERVRAAFGVPSILINNAGINPAYGTLMDLDLGLARKIAEVNLLGALAWTQVAVQAGLGADGDGVIVNIGSISGSAPSPGIGWYGVTKAGVAHLTATLALELAPRVRVNGIVPAVVKTEFGKPLYEGREAEVAAEYPLGRLGVPEDVANAVAFLVSEESSWITGQMLTLDGGLVLAGGRA
ncbi:3-ketoacyl-ACP reductase [Microbacterium sp. CH12i]|uniref:SDR family oxidoreductase n=1 Tax=Microbacterium sp. CH12i TaxID=1479651 RepID=UPI0004617E99|nr:SDR family oxidoreductase [Microbacterium sp. CH12i]KDA05339.1 3-ketoacyl-ACP reductase [Microbacterium sp. CH12i]